MRRNTDFLKGLYVIMHLKQVWV